MKMRTPLSSVRGLGSAKEGTGHFWHQRVTSMASIPLTLFLVVAFVYLNGASYEEAKAFLGSPVVAVLMVATVITMAYHMCIGVQVVIEDYLHTHGVKVLALLLSRFAHVLVAVASVYAILRIGITVGMAA